MDDNTPNLITPDDAASIHGIRTKHEQMPSGEFRFRLTSSDGNDYIRTAACSTGAWQKAHYHRSLQETYIVESGWMALAKEVNGKLICHIHWPSDVTTIKPTVIHNIYLPASAVIHTIKHGANAPGDWHESPSFTDQTTCLSERDLLTKKCTTNSTNNSQSQHFEAYVLLYNTLDNLSWKIPSYIATGAVVLPTLTTILYSQRLSSFPSTLITILFLFASMMLFISAYSHKRIRQHHTWAGNHLARMEPEPDGYFHHRCEITRQKWPPSANYIIFWFYIFLMATSLSLAIISAIKPDWLIDLVKWHN
jgi:hypothetical protein